MPTGGWTGSIMKRGAAGFSSGDAPNILHGETLIGFELIGRGLPTIRKIEIKPWWIYVSEGPATKEDTQQAREIEKSITFKTNTLGPTAPPFDMDYKAFLETTRGYINESVTLGWLIDPTLTNTLRTYLDTTATYIDANDPSSAKATLQEFMATIEGASSTQRTTEAYGLLYFNVRYLHDKLPETVIPSLPTLELTPSEVTLPIGTLHILMAIYKEGGEPYSEAPVTLQVTSGPNAGLVLEERTDITGTATFSYTSTLLGTDELKAEVPEVPDLYMGATSSPVYVTWAGGPDLIVPLFMPPLIKSEGGKPIFITEITGNSGTTSAGPSITRYFLSEDEIIDPNQDYPIGERDIPSLVPGEESDGGTQEFILPDDIPAGTYHLGACADVDQSVIELDELNNCEINRLAIVVSVEPPSNQPPDCTQAISSADRLWPPNHRLVSISISGITDPDGDPVSITITGITQDEPVNGLGDGDTSPDGVGVGSSQAQVRAERSGIGNGRVYAVSFTAEDSRGGSCSGSVQVGVPHDQGQGATPIDDGQNYDSTMP